MSNTVKLPTCPKCGLPIPKEAPQGLCPKCVLLGVATGTEQGVPATATSEIPSIERISKAFPQLEILELIGRGGMGFVFKARQPHLDRYVALKLLPDKLAKDPQFAERFNREGRVLAKLNHPNITSVFDFGHASAGTPVSDPANGVEPNGRPGSETGAPSGQPKTANPKPGTSDGGFYYLTMEYVDGVNLRQAMRAGRFSPAEALSIVPKVCEALQYAHEQGILHRDIKPENILLDAKGRVKIADFGIAKLVGEDQPNITLTNTGAALGTPHYMAPEQLEKPATVDHRADIYSLGVVFYEMLTGELPIGRFAAPSSKTPVNASVDDIVFRTLEKDRERRFQSAGEMKTQVEHLGDAQPEVDPRGSQTSGAAPLIQPRWLKPVAGTFLTFAVLGLVATIQSISSAKFEFNLLVLLALTSLALLLRSEGLRKAAVFVNCVGLLFPWLSAFKIGATIHDGTLALNSLVSVADEAAGSPLMLLFAVLESSIWAGALFVLLKRDARNYFDQPSWKATAHWAGDKEVSHQRGPLKWGFIAVLLIGMGVVLVTNRPHESRRTVIPAENSTAGGREAALELEPMIQFTFTTVELREEQGARWLAMDYVEQVRGDCQHTFRYDARVPGFTPQTRMDSSLSDAKAGFAPVLYQRVMWKLPESMEQGDLTALRDLVAKEWIGKSTVIEPGDERVLFKSLVPDGGTMAAAVGVTAKQSRQEARSSELEFRLVADGADFASSVDELPERLTDGSEIKHRVLRTIMLDGSAVARAVLEAEPTGTVAISVELSLEGARQFGAITAANTGRRLAIVSHGRVLSAPVIRSAISGGQVKISGAFSADEASRLVASLNRPHGKATSANQAAAEHWSPKLAPGEKPNLTEILQEARTLAEDGRHEEALQRHIWYHNHSLELDDAQAGVRLSYALADWMKLARHYPKAREALVEITDRAAQKFAGGEGHYALFAEVSAINAQLGRQKETLALFDSIQSRDHKLARQCYLTVEDMLVEKGDYALCESFIPDFQKRFETIRTVRERTLQLMDRTPEANRSSLRQHAQQTFIKDTRKLVEILVGVSRNTEASAIRDQAVAVLDVPELRSAVTDAEEKVAKHSVAPEKP